MTCQNPCLTRVESLPKVSERHSSCAIWKVDAQRNRRGNSAVRRDGGGARWRGQGSCWRSGSLDGASPCRAGRGGGAVPTGGVGCRTGLGGVFHDQSRKSACGGKGGGYGAISVKVAALTEGVMKAMCLPNSRQFSPSCCSWLRGDRGDCPHLPHGGGAGG